MKNTVKNLSKGQIIRSAFGIKIEILEIQKGRTLSKWTGRVAEHFNQYYPKGKVIDGEAFSNEEVEII